jgi:mono/diheme cytochrome c family protein
MKTLAIIFGITLAAIFTGTTLAQVQVKEAPLTWQQAALTDGEDLFMELCASCHGKGGMGDGPAAPALKNTVPDLTALAAHNGGTFPREAVEKSITGKSRVVSHGTIDMPIWGQAFEDVRPDRKTFERKALAKQRIYNLTEYLATIQAK